MEKLMPKFIPTLAVLGLLAGLIILLHNEKPTLRPTAHTFIQCENMLMISLTSERNSTEVREDFEAAMKVWPAGCTRD